MKRVFLATTALLTLSTPGLSQEGETDTGEDVIIVEVTRTQLDSFVYPGATATVDTETLDLTRPADLDDLLRQLPGVEISGGPASHRPDYLPARPGPGQYNPSARRRPAEFRLGA